MNIVFNTNSFLHRHRFIKTRKTLSGEQLVDSSARRGEKLLFSSSQMQDQKKPWFVAVKSSRFKTVLDDLFLANDKSVTSLDTRIDSLARKKARRISNLSRFKHRPKRHRNKLVGLFLSLVTVLSILFVALLFVPAVYYQIFPADVIELVPGENGSPIGGEFASQKIEPSSKPKPYIPPKDETLPQGDWLIIPRIGVRTPLRKTEKPEVALEKGVWQVPDFGVPGDRTQPMILAAHRFGWQWWWKDEYWKYNSFYNLPTTEPGDMIEIISDQRKWIYEIYAGEEGEEITDYKADLILYTCKFLKSPIRHFRYARIVDPTVMTQ